MNRPFLIGVGGAHSGVGKTTLAVALLRYFTASSKAPFLSLTRWGAIKFTKTLLHSVLVDEEAVLTQKDKDTAKLLEAGAEKVIWIKSPRRKLAKVLPHAMERLSHLDGIVVEGNSAIEFLKPDIVIFKTGLSTKNMKASAGEILSHADIIALPVTQEPTERDIGRDKCAVFFDPSDGKTLLELVHCMEIKVKSKSIEELLTRKAEDGKVPCHAARAIAEELGVSYAEVGKAANDLQIKINNCELGCF